MKIFSVSQIRAADQFTIEHEPIASIDFMERAARACYQWFHNSISRSKSISIYCGKGNNGGDGLALARMLISAGYKSVKTFVVNHSDTVSGDFAMNLARLQEYGHAPNELSNSDVQDNSDVIVDAMLGSGLNKPLKGLLADVTDRLNNLDALKISIDIPTGLFADDNAKNSMDYIFRADHTFSFQFPKKSFLFPEYGPLAGKIHILDIGLSATFIAKEPSTDYFVDQQVIESILPERHKFDHKGTFGHALIIAGSEGKVGAAILSSKASIRTGCGLVSAYLPYCGLIPMQSAIPEIMAIVDKGESILEQIQLDFQPDAIGIGPGIGTAKSTQVTFLAFISELQEPMVVDADGINILASANGFDRIPKFSILTPHLGELDRLLGRKHRGEDIYNAAKAFAIEMQVVLVIKGAHSGIYTPSGHVYFNSTGTNGMATAGSGDVLTGMITGFLAQGIDPVHAAICGVYFHGLAGENAAIQRGNAAMTAIDIIEHIKIEL